ncbi:MAG: hypothetical protein ABI892_11465, partial [Flavobacterium sp.]
PPKGVRPLTKESLSAEFPSAWNIKEVKEGSIVGYQFFPHLLRGEGFFISVLKPGNFVHQYELRKMQLNKYVAGSTQEMLFSAVKIDVYTRNQQTDNATMFSSSKHSRYYEFTIDHGDQTNDTYLTNNDSSKNTYTAFYNGEKYDGDIAVNTVLTFSKKVNTEKGAQIVPDWILAELKITQKRNSGPDNIIFYNNLNIKQK